MKRIFVALALALSLLAAAAMAEETSLEIYVSAEAMPIEMAQQLTALIGRALDLTDVTLIDGAKTGTTLRELVLMDRAPDIALCAPEEAMLWAKEGLLAPMDGCVPDETRMQRQVLDACSLDGELFMAPLMARHRMLAVNRRMLEGAHLGELLDARAHPVWYPLEMQQVIEEFALDGGVAAEIWPLTPGTSAGVEALVQAFYGGAFLSEDGRVCQAEGGSAVAGVAWLADMVGSGQIGWAQSREEALSRFLAGKTALFIDWTDADARASRASIDESGLEIVTVPYPSSSGMPVRSFDVTGAAVFLTGDEQTDALARQAVAFLGEDAQAQLILGNRAIWADGAVWLPSLSAHPQGALLRTALCEALASALTGGQPAAAAMRGVAAALEAAK